MYEMYASLKNLLFKGIFDPQDWPRLKQFGDVADWNFQDLTAMACMGKLIFGARGAGISPENR